MGESFFIPDAPRRGVDRMGAFRCGNQIALPLDGKGIDFLRQFDYNAWYKRQLRRQFHD